MLPVTTQIPPSHSGNNYEMREIHENRKGNRDRRQVNQSSRASRDDFSRLSRVS